MINASVGLFTHAKSGRVDEQLEDQSRHPCPWSRQIANVGTYRALAENRGQQGLDGEAPCYGSGRVALRRIFKMRAPAIREMVADFSTKKSRRMLRIG